MKYTIGDPAGQESIRSFGDVFTDENASWEACENECFATFPTLQKHAQTPVSQAVRANQRGKALVCANIPTTWAKQKPIYDEWLNRTYAGNPAKAKKIAAYIKGRQKRAFTTSKKGKAWIRLSAEDRSRRTLDFAFRSEALAWTLNFSAKQEARLRKSERPAKMLADAIHRAAKRELGRAVMFSLALEVTAERERLHAHGIVVLERGEGAKFCKALKSAGGKVHGFGSGRQTDIRRLFNATGWANYIAKDFDRTAKALGTDKIVYQCRATVAAARAEYEASYSRQKAARAAKRRPKPSPAPETAIATHQTRRKPSHSPRHSPVRHRTVRRPVSQRRNRPLRHGYRPLTAPARTATGPP